MQEKSAFLLALLELESLRDKSRALPFDQRKDILEVRRKINEQNVRLTAIGEDTFRGRPELKQFRQELSALRAVVAFFMASWPVVAMDPDNAEFVRDGIKLNEAYSRFSAWARQVDI